MPDPHTRKHSYTVTSLTSAIHKSLTSTFDGIRVEGEISGFKQWPSGHCYFTLKDAGAQIRCVLFRGSLRYLRIKPRDGMAVIARGTVEVRAERGEYQFNVSSLEAVGEGALQAAFEQLKRRLLEEGLFDQDRKRLLPRFPLRIGIVTSPAGAVIRDILSVARRRWPLAHYRLYPAQVQGAGSIEAVCAGLDYFSRSGWPQIIVLARGGGSIEDLWTFNEEAVARAIARSEVPVVSAIGHETDFTIADFAADLRAPTPSAAAELITPSAGAVLDAVEHSARRIRRSVELLLAQYARRVDNQGVHRAARLVLGRIGGMLQTTDECDLELKNTIRTHLRSRSARLESAAARMPQLDPRFKLARDSERNSGLKSQAAAAIRSQLAQRMKRLDNLAARLEATSPLAVLERGYAIIEGPAGIVTGSEALSPGDEVRARLARGRFAARVTTVDPPASKG